MEWAQNKNANKNNEYVLYEHPFLHRVLSVKLPYKAGGDSWNVGTYLASKNIALNQETEIISFNKEKGTAMKIWHKNLTVAQATYINLISSSAIDFGTLTVGESKADNYTVKYSNGTSGKALNMSSNNANFVLGTTSKPEGQYAQKTFGVTFAPATSGRFSGTITLNNGVSKTITLSGVAIPATVVAKYASDVMPSSFTANWDAVAGANDYTVRLYNANGVLLRTEMTDGTSFNFKGLGSTTTYGYAVVANGNDDTHSASESNVIWVGTATPAMVSALVWSDATGDGLWSTTSNWKVNVDGVMRNLDPADTFDSALDIIIPAPENSKYLQGELILSDTYGYAPSLSKGYGNVRLTDEKVATNIILEYGALFNVDEFAGTGVCDTIVTSMVVKGEDRGEWILAGATLQIFDETGMRPM